MADKFDYKKEYKDLYLPPKKPMVIEVPEMTFIAVDGQGDPNTCPAYRNALEMLYGLSWTIKMSKMGGEKPPGYFEYVVPPLEGLWWVDDTLFNGFNIKEKGRFCWTSMIRQPEFVNMETLEWACKRLSAKKMGLDLAAARLWTFQEGLCVQMMHIGSYDEEADSIQLLERFTEEAGYTIDISSKRRHHEIYLSDPRKCQKQNLKTVIRQPIKKA